MKSVCSYKNFEVHFRPDNTAYHEPSGIYDTFCVWLKVEKAESGEYKFPILRRVETATGGPTKEEIEEELKIALVFLSKNASPQKAAEYLERRSAEFFRLMRERKGIENG